MGRIRRQPVERCAYRAAISLAIGFENLSFCHSPVMTVYHFQTLFGKIGRCSLNGLQTYIARMTETFNKTQSIIGLSVTFLAEIAWKSVDPLQTYIVLPSGEWIWNICQARVNSRCISTNFTHIFSAKVVKRSTNAHRANDFEIFTETINNSHNGYIFFVKLTWKSVDGLRTYVVLPSDEFGSVTYVVRNMANDAFDQKFGNYNKNQLSKCYDWKVCLAFRRLVKAACAQSGRLLPWHMHEGDCATAWLQYRYLKYDDTDFSLEIAPITRVMAIKAKGSANYGPQCMCRYMLLNI